MGPVALTCVCAFESGLSTPIRVSLIVAPNSSPRGFGRVDGFGQRVFLRSFPFDVISQCLCIHQTRKKEQEKIRKRMEEVDRKAAAEREADRERKRERARRAKEAEPEAIRKGKYPRCTQ